MGHASFVAYAYPVVNPTGIHTRLYARAFALESPCNSKRVMFVSMDTPLNSWAIRQQVLAAIAADPALSPYYGPENVMLSATHTHEATGGFGSISDNLNLPDVPVVSDFLAYVESAVVDNSAWDNDNFNAIVSGVSQAIRRANANLQAHPDTASITMSIGELLNANRNRDPLAYEQNPPSEKAKYLDANGNDITVDKRFLQLNFIRNNGSSVGVLNWFGVHPTAMGNHGRLISSDIKGVAGLEFEKMMGTLYAPDANGKPDGIDNFVAAFAQTDEGNSVPDLYGYDKDVNGSDAPGAGVPYARRFGTDDPYNYTDTNYERGERKAAEAFGVKQLAQALTQYAQGNALAGPIDYRLFYVDMNSVTVTDPVILNGLAAPDLPASLYDGPISTCTNGMGVAFANGGLNGRGFGAAGFYCGVASDAPVPYWNDARNHYNGIFNGSGSLDVIFGNNAPLVVPINGVVLDTALTPLFCLNTLSSEYSCQQQKPVVESPYESNEYAPFQIFRLGNLAVLGVPWEVTTMAARRLRQTVLDALAPVGVDTVVIAGLSNDYMSYMATREEYTAQMYEGASTVFGPWQLAAAQQEARQLALTLANNQPSPAGPSPQPYTLGPASPIIVDSNANFGAVVTDAQSSYTQGDTVDVSWVSGYPSNDLKTMSSYLYVERQNAQGGWDVVATDRDPELLFIWNSSATFISEETKTSGPSTAEAVWEIPANTANGTYRIRHEGVYRLSASAAPVPYTGVTSVFQVTGVPAACP